MILGKETPEGPEAHTSDDRNILLYERYGVKDIFSIKANSFLSIALLSRQRSRQNTRIRPYLIHGKML